MKLNIAVTSLCVLLAADQYVTDTEARLSFGTDINRLLKFRQLKRSKPFKIALSVKDGTFVDSVDAIDPLATWEDSLTLGDEDQFAINYGVEAALNLGPNASRRVWGRGTTSVKGFGVSVKGDLDIREPNTLGLEFDAEKEDDSGISASVDATAQLPFGGEDSEADFEVTGVRGCIIRDTNIANQEGKLAITPRLNLADGTKDILVGYKSGKTTAELKIANEEKTLTLQRHMQWDNTIGCVVSTEGTEHLILDYERDLGNGGTLNIDYQNHQSSVVWADGNGWEAKATVDVTKEGLSNANVKIGTNLEF